MFAVSNLLTTRLKKPLVASGVLAATLSMTACSATSSGPTATRTPAQDIAATAPATATATATSKGKPKPVATTTPTGSSPADISIRAAASAQAALRKAASLAAATTPEGTPGQ